MPRTLGWTAALALLLTAACAEPTTAPVRDPELPAPSLSTGPSGPLQFHWLPTVVPSAGPFIGSFDADRMVTARVICVQATGPRCPTVIAFSRISLSLATAISVDRTREAYRATWRTPSTLTLGGGGYRLEVYEGTTLLGQIPLTVVATALEVATVPTGTAGVLRGGSFAFAFRLERLPAASQLPGAPGDPAVAAIPLLVSPSTGRNFTTGHPDLPGLPMSVNDVIVHVAQDATVAQVNAVLTEFGAQLIGGVPGVPQESPGVLILRLPTSTHAGLEALLVQMRQRPGILMAGPDVQLEGLVLPAPNGANPPAWDWISSLTGGDNFGLKQMDVPQLWNLNDLVRRSGARTETGVLDVGFFSHPDVVFASHRDPQDTDDHGIHVAGTIAATFGNGIGIEGVTPFANLHAVPLSGSAQMFTAMIDLIDQNPSLRVINASLGYNWYKHTPAIDASTSLLAQGIASLDGLSLLRGLYMLQARGRTLPVIVAAAGNDSNRPGWTDIPARYATPFANAALALGVAPIIVVEAIDQTQARASFSNTGGHLSAPGVAVMSTVGTSGYAAMNGTSMATPHIAGLVSYLYSLEPALPAPTMASNPMLDLLVRHSQPASGTPAGFVNAFWAAMDVDRVMGSDRVLRGLLDIDDGSIDGNLRVDTTGAAVTSNDLDGDFHPGDGVIDMSDFRRFRDWLLDVEASSGLLLDGGAAHPKRDLNEDGVLGGSIFERISPRGDFNGDGTISRISVAMMTGVLEGQNLTDLAVLQSRFSDPDYAASDLPNLLSSADISVDLAACMALPSAGSVRLEVRPQGSATIIQQRTVALGDNLQVLTVPTDAAGYEVEVTVIGQNGVTPVGDETLSAPAGLGQDSHHAPTCASLAITITPGSVTLSPSQGQQFTASVTGSTNTAVTWTASGGTINTYGIYTAGSGTGTFAVTATSVADPSRSATAVVTIVTGTTPPPTPTVGLQITSLFSGGKPTSPIRYRARVTNLPGVTVQWTASAYGNGTGYFPNGPINASLWNFGALPPQQTSAYVVDWFADLVYGSGILIPGVTTGVSITVRACYFQPNGQPVRDFFGNAICHINTSNF